jgi:hypothetical protein
MTISRFAIAGAAVLNVPTLVAASALPTSAVVLGAVFLAAAGAALGAITGWAIIGRIDAAVATPAIAEAATVQRIAA